MNARLMQLTRTVKNNLGVFTYKDQRGFKVGNANCKKGGSTKGISEISHLETVVSKLRYFDPNTPGTYITVDFDAGTQHKEVTITGIYARVMCRNNYHIPVYLDIYDCSPKSDTSIGLGTSINNGLADIGIGSRTDDAQTYPNDSPQFRDLYKTNQHKKWYLAPGAQRTLRIAIGAFNFDHSLVDEQTDSYQKRFKSRAVYFRTSGCIAHDDTQAEYGFAQGGVDVIIDRVTRVEYPAGANIEFMETETDIGKPADPGKGQFSNLGRASHVDVENLKYQVSTT